MNDSNMNILEITDKQLCLRREAVAIVDKTRLEKRELTEEEQALYDDIKVQIDELNKQKEELEKKIDEPVNEKTEEVVESVEPNDDENEETEKRNINNNMNNKGLAEAIRSAQNGEQIALRDITVGTYTEGTVGTKSTLVENIKNALVLDKMGARILTGLKDNQNFSLYSGSTSGWVAETGTKSDGAGTFTPVVLQPHRIACVVNVSNTFLKQTDAEQFIIDDVTRSIASAIEGKIFSADAADSTSGVRAGLFNGVTADSAAFTYAETVNMEGSVEANNYKPTAYVISAGAKSVARSTQKGNGLGFIYDDNSNSINGIPAFFTNNVASKGIAVLDASKLVVGIWGDDMDLVVDNLSQADKGITRVIVNCSVDFAMLDNNAIAKRIVK